MNEAQMGPVRTGKTEESISLANCLFPVNARVWLHRPTYTQGPPVQLEPGEAVVDPILLSLPGSASLYLPVFDSEELLRETLGKMQIEFGRVLRIDDGSEWLESLPKELIVIKNPRFTANGTVKFLQILR